MPMAYRIDHERRTVFSRGWGLLSDAQVIGHYIELVAEPAFDCGFDQLCDISRITTLDVSPLTLRSLAADTAFADDARRAIVAPGDYEYGTCRMFQSYCNSDSVQVFRRRAEAANWLGLSADEPNGDQ